ncbi:hypothetical protein P9250_22855 [Caballeronia sp. LP006]|uniref:hypothetical protein n=1 Tax=Caballeronia sp. LP006 TaxID=3038552 RepID=UPI002860029B|nr:hypothetical protein [Caballeronia sp. LP006]MDR5830716.1 hypothetical protein [Caballeronia sp. LP006]
MPPEKKAVENDVGGVGPILSQCIFARKIDRTLIAAPVIVAGYVVIPTFEMETYSKPAQIQ